MRRSITEARKPGALRRAAERGVSFYAALRELTELALFAILLANSKDRRPRKGIIVEKTACAGNPFLRAR